MGKKKLPHEKSYPALIDLAVYIKELETSLAAVEKVLDTDTIHAYITALKNAKTSRFRTVETLNTLNNSLVELGINIEAFYKELNALDLS